MFNKKSLPKMATTWKKDLQNILNDGIISPKLRYAIEEIIKALNVLDWDLAYQLTAVKSFITGIINPKAKAYAFQEDHDANKKILGNSVYCILDGIHHDIAFAIDELPSGVMVLKGDGKISEHKARGVHPIVRRIKYEHQMIEKSVKQREHENSLEEVAPARKLNWRKPA
jgi:hypothetical protein